MFDGEIRSEYVTAEVIDRDGNRGPQTRLLAEHEVLDHRLSPRMKRAMTWRRIHAGVSGAVRRNAGAKTRRCRACPVGVVSDPRGEQDPWAELDVPAGTPEPE